MKLTCKLSCVLEYEQLRTCPASLKLEIEYAPALYSQSICFVTGVFLSWTVHLASLVILIPAAAAAASCA